RNVIAGQRMGNGHVAEISNLARVFEQNAKIQLWYRLCDEARRQFSRIGGHMFGLNKSKSIVGLDIGSSAVKAVELRPNGKGFKVAAVALQPVPPASNVHRATIDGGAGARAHSADFA